MRSMLIRVTIAIIIVASMVMPAVARDGDTLDPIAIDAPTLETYPEDFFNENDERAIEQRINEARASGVPLAVRIVDLSQPSREIPFLARQYADENFDGPIPPELQQQLVQAWAEDDPIETSTDADDGFLLLVLVPEDRTQTTAIWWIGPNALPINGLTQDNILATHSVMNEQFANGNVPNGIFVGLLEFSYNIQFGTPERLERTELQDALHTATIPMAIATAVAGIAIPVLAIWLSRRSHEANSLPAELSPWEAAALHEGRARKEITAAMLMDAVHRDEIAPTTGGGIRIAPGPSNAAVESMRHYANEDGAVEQVTMYEVEAITLPVREEIESTLVQRGAMISTARPDRNRMLLVMGVTLFLMALTTVPSVKSMSAIGAFAIGIGLLGLGIGWWWLAYRRYTTRAGGEMLATWLDSATEAERSKFDLVIYQDLISEQDGGPDSTAQTQLLRQFRGVGAT